MPNKVRTHMDADTMSDGKMMPKHLTKQEFARRIYNLMVGRGWTQSELARQADLPRDSVSVYMRAKSLPTPQSLQKLARALGVPAEELLPNHLEHAMDEENPAFDMKVSNANPSKAWVRVNRLVNFSTATKIAELLEADASN